MAVKMLLLLLQLRGKRFIFLSIIERKQLYLRKNIRVREREKQREKKPKCIIGQE